MKNKASYIGALVNQDEIWIWIILLMINKESWFTILLQSIVILAHSVCLNELFDVTV